MITTLVSFLLWFGIVMHSATGWLMFPLYLLFIMDNTRAGYPGTAIIIYHSMTDGTGDCLIGTIPSTPWHQLLNAPGKSPQLAIVTWKNCGTPPMDLKISLNTKKEKV